MKTSRSLGALVAITLALICTNGSTNLFALKSLHESTLRAAEGNLNRYSLMLAENANRSFKSLDLILSSVGDYLLREGATDAESYRRLGSEQKIHVLLKEKFAGLLELDAVTLIDVNGKLINFSRYWPIPDVNVSDRDYFKALKSDLNLASFVSEPVRDRGNGTWTNYLARRLNGVRPFSFRRTRHGDRRGGGIRSPDRLHRRNRLQADIVPATVDRNG